MFIKITVQTVQYSTYVLTNHSTVQYSTDIQTNHSTDSTVQYKCRDKSQYSVVQMYRKLQYRQYSTDVQTNHSTDSTV